jgi:TatA/E family protein of Tat protein translocase
MAETWPRPRPLELGQRLCREDVRRVFQVREAALAQVKSTPSQRLQLRIKNAALEPVTFRAPVLTKNHTLRAVAAKLLNPYTPIFRAGRCPALLPIRLPQYHGCMNLGFPEMIFIFIGALILFGPKKLPEIGRQIGRALNEFKRASNEFKSQIETEIANLERETTTTPQYLPPADPVRGTVPVGAVVDAPSESPAPAQLATDAESAAKAADA